MSTVVKENRVNAMTKAEEKAHVPVPVSSRGVVLTTLDEIYRFATAVSQSGLAPKGLEKPQAILVAIQLGLELGLSPMSALQNIAIVNGRPSVYGDAALALVRASGLLENYTETEIGEKGKDTWGFRIVGKRKGEAHAKEEFTVADAKTAGLWGKQGPWSTYPKRMLKFRARSFFLRDHFSDVLKGIGTVEEQRDVPLAEKLQEMPAPRMERVTQVISEACEQASGILDEVLSEGELPPDQEPIAPEPETASVPLDCDREDAIHKHRAAIAEARGIADLQACKAGIEADKELLGPAHTRSLLMDCDKAGIRFITPKGLGKGK